MAMYSHPSGSLKRRCVSTTLLSPVGCHCPSQPFLAVGLALGLNRMPLACHAAAARCSTSWLNFRLNIRQPVKYTIFSPARIVLNWDLNVVLFMGMGSTFEEMRPSSNADKRGDDDQGDGYCAVFAHGRSSTMKPYYLRCDRRSQLLWIPINITCRTIDIIWFRAFIDCMAFWASIIWYRIVWSGRIHSNTILNGSFYHGTRMI